MPHHALACLLVDFVPVAEVELEGGRFALLLVAEFLANVIEVGLFSCPLANEICVNAIVPCGIFGIADGPVRGMLEFHV